MRGRPPNAEPYVFWRIAIPERIARQAEILLCDPLRGIPVYGSRSKLVTAALVRWIKEQQEAAKDAVAKVKKICAECSHPWHGEEPCETERGDGYIGDTYQALGPCPCTGEQRKEVPDGLRTDDDSRTSAGSPPA
jgi:hypothetical protein